MTRALTFATILLPLVLLADPAAAQPKITNGRVQTHPAGAALDQTVRAIVGQQSEPAWIGYTVPSTGHGRVCCVGCMTDDRGIALETGRPIRLEGPQTLVVLYRVEERAVQRVRFFSEDCELDAGGRTIHWLEGVKPADSVRMLSSFLSRDDRPSSAANSALVAIAMHEDSVAVPALLDAARQHASPKVRGDALFWLAQKAGDKAAGAITERLEQDPDTDVKKRAVFALSQLPGDEGVPLLIQVAKTSKNAAVRKQAMFWLGQSHDRRALDFFAEVLTK
jgi:hypothetical protein